jgi:cephalosporin-C deacetylase-like acetyl esterase
VIIAMIGDDAEDYLARSFALWFQKKGFNVLTMLPGKKDYGHHNYPLERFEAAIAFLKERGNVRIGIAGASTSGMLALTAASFFPDITFGGVLPGMTADKFWDIIATESEDDDDDDWGYYYDDEWDY